MTEEGKKNGGEEQRSYFRVDDVISVVANPISIDDEAREKLRHCAMSSKAFSLMESSPSTREETTEYYTLGAENSKLYAMMEEIKAKMDFIINHFMLEKEGLLKPEKKFVNISASGLRFTLEKQVKVKDVLEIKLLLPTYPPVAVFAYGEVKRAKKLNDNKYEVAIEYLNMGESVRNEIIQYTLCHQRESIRKQKAGVK
jgi:hypothetical protein